MPRLPSVADVQQVSPRVLRTPALRAPRDTSGEALVKGGAQLTAVANAELARMEAAEQKIQTRRDTIARVRSGASFKARAEELLSEFQTARDPNDPDAASNFGKQLQGVFAEALEGYQGTDLGRLDLESDLEQVRADLVRRAAEMINKQDNELISDSATAAINEIAASTEGSVKGVEAGFFRLDRSLEKLAPAMDENALRDKTREGRKQIIMTAIQPLLDQGTEVAAEAVDALISRPDVVAALGEDIGKVRSKVVKIRVDADKGRRAGEQKVAETAAILGIRPDQVTPEMRTRIAGLDRRTPQTLSEKITEFEAVVGRPATEQEIAKIADASVGEDPVFGKGLAGRVLAIVTDNAPAFANGLLSQEVENQFIAAVVHAQQPVTFLNPDTQVMEQRRPKLPPFVIEALQRRGREDLIAKDEVETPFAQAGGGEPQPEFTGETIFQKAKKITGPVPAAMSGLGRIPVVGEFVNSSEFTQARKFVELQTKDLVRTLQNSTRYADTERQAIQKDIDLSGEVIDTPKAYRDRLIGMDDSLETRQQTAMKTASSRLVSGEERQHAMNVFNALVQFRERLGVPPVVTPEEARKLPPGTEFRFNDGKGVRVWDPAKGKDG